MGHSVREFGRPNAFAFPVNRFRPSQPTRQCLDERLTCTSRQRSNALPANPRWNQMDHDPELKRLAWRAHHRGTREADMLVGGFFDAHHASWSADERALFAEILDEQDADIMAWAHGTAEPPERFSGPMIQALQKLDSVPVAR